MPKPLKELKAKYRRPEEVFARPDQEQTSPWVGILTQLAELSAEALHELTRLMTKGDDSKAEGRDTTQPPADER